MAFTIHGPINYEMLFAILLAKFGVLFLQHSMMRAFFAKQNGKNLSTYYGELTDIFGELDHRDKAIMTCAHDIEIYRKSIQRQRVHIFLVGLDVEFEQIHGEILRKYPIPELEATYALIRRESVRRATINS
ncbi:unnamed protein product [Prunus armeniaca]|uniref:Retrotransposon gag domain-containing protein n=1 Tax=Prunus armeniaca TaxID=36596 RepID=A0A6J5X4S9_PRUAR|nr:unnamed protein product [Prunus armeniaca]CAB4308760.1 unnamed protein product [Prunus armeniaca]